MSLGKTLQVSVYRYNPEQDAAPFMQDFNVEIDGKDLMVLDVLALIKEQDEGFSYRRSCREGVLRLRRHEYQRQERPGLHHSDLFGGKRQQAGDSPAARSAGHS